jgi:hypothetical protein
VLGTAWETVTVLALTGAKTALLEPAPETDAAHPLGFGAGQALAAAEALETAQPLTGGKTALLGTVWETDTAHPLTAPSTIVPSPERTYRIPAERRVLAVTAERRVFAVTAEPRTLTVR